MSGRSDDDDYGLSVLCDPRDWPNAIGSKNVTITASPVEQARDGSKVSECNGLECQADYQAKSKRQSLTLEDEVFNFTFTGKVHRSG
ncbi:hypothetical protein HZ326_5668 [Fusarium oxysporum f. sp. albedinis]|nr:hypothetical protein HZ326_5668 [Fusarium oxysporum f. sp. albedinis]